MAKKVLTVPTYSYEDTSDPNLKRFVDVDGNWTHYWLVKEKRFVKAITHVLGLGYNKGPRFNEYLLSITKDEQQKVLLEAGDRGSRTHKAVQDLISGVRVTMESKYPSDVTGRQERLSMREWKNLVGWMAFCAVYKPRLVAHEKAIYSTKNEYAGTFDAVLVITVPSADKFFPKAVWGKDILFFPDWKTSAGIWDEYKAQTAAYLEGILERGMYVKFLEAYKGRIFTGVVRIGTKHQNGGFEVKMWDEKTTRGRNFKLFLSAKNIADEYEPEFVPDVEQMPIALSINMPLATVAKAPTAHGKPKKK